MNPAIAVMSAFALRAAACLLCTCAVVPAAHANDESQALDRVSVWLGGYYPDAAFDIHARATRRPDLDGRLHVDAGKETVGRLRLDFLVEDSQGFTVDYYTLDRTRRKHLSRTFDYDGVPFRIDTDLAARFDFSAGSLAWHWWFGSARDVFGVGLGATRYQVAMTLDGSASALGQSADARVHWSDSAAAPLLTLGYKHAFSDALRVYANASGVRKNGGTLAGHIVDARTGVEWFPWPHFGFGAEYGTTRIHLSRDATHYSADLDVDLRGPSAFARWRF